MHRNANPTIAVSALLLLILLAGCISPFGDIPALKITQSHGCGDQECQEGEADTDPATGLMNCPEDCAICTDTDGVNFYAAGNASDTSGASVIDSCSGDELIEGFCNYGAARGFSYDCPEGCADSEGRCAGAGSEITEYCVLVDGDNPSNSVLLAVGENVCSNIYFPDLEVVFTCSESDGGLGFELVEDCEPGGRVCLDGGCVPVSYFMAIERATSPDEIEDIRKSANFLLVKLNHNNTELLGDGRAVQVTGAGHEPIGGARFDVTTPKGTVLRLSTDASGIVEFKLREAGTYSVAVQKAGYEDFSGEFEVPGMVLEFAQKRRLGEMQAIAVRTAYGGAVGDAHILLVTPDGRKKTLTTDGGGIAHVKITMPGRHEVELSRKDVNIVNAHFLGTEAIDTIVSSIVSFVLAAGGDASVEAPMRLAMLAALALGAMLFAYFRLRPIIPNAVSTRQKRREFLLRGGLSAAFFAAPFAMNRAMDVAGGIALAIFEIVVVLVLYYISKSMLRMQKPKIEVRAAKVKKG